MSWAFIHYARNQEPKLFSQLLAVTARVDADSAFRATFGGRGEALDKAIFTYMKQGQYQQVVLKVPLTSPVTVQLSLATEQENQRIQEWLAMLEKAMNGAP